MLQPRWTTRAPWVALLAGLSLAGCGRAQPDRPALSVFTAASTAEVLADLAKRFEQQHHIPVHLNVAASSTLARQIEAGAPCDVIISANTLWMDHLQRADRLVPGTRRNLAGNTLVLIAPKHQPFQARIAPDFDLSTAFAGRLAVGDPAHVPAGIYARQALQALGWWESLQDRLVPCMDVRAALRRVETAQVLAGVVYATDAAGSSNVAVVGKFPSHTHDAIRYPVALCKPAGPQAEKFLRFLSTDPARQVWVSHGFTLP